MSLVLAINKVYGSRYGLKGFNADQRSLEDGVCGITCRISVLTVHEYNSYNNLPRNDPGLGHGGGSDKVLQVWNRVGFWNAEQSAKERKRGARAHGRHRALQRKRPKNVGEHSFRLRNTRKLFMKGSIPGSSKPGAARWGAWRRGGAY